MRRFLGPEVQHGDCRQNLHRMLESSCESGSLMLLPSEQQDWSCEAKGGLTSLFQKTFCDVYTCQIVTMHLLNRHYMQIASA